jgi:phage/plasmid-like protein (TIGR03299 family)
MSDGTLNATTATGTGLASGVGINVPGNLTANEALVYGKLDWTVSLRDLNVSDRIVTTHKATVRDDNQAILGIVKRRYRVVNNHQVASFLSGLFGQSAAIIEKVAALEGGAKLFFLAKIPHRTFEVRPGDPTEVYLLCSSSHDASMGISIAFTSIRVACLNSLSAALRTSKNIITVRHTRNFERNLAQAGRVVAKSEDYWSRFKVACQEMSKLEVNRQEVESFLRRIFPANVNDDGKTIETASILAARSRVLALFDGEAQGSELAGKTRYGLYNSLAQWIDREKPTRSGNRWLSANLGGSGETLRQKGWDILLGPSLN